MSNMIIAKKNILKIINSVEIIDIHTHLFPQNHSNFFLSGADEIFNYHYLTAEYLSSSKYSAISFFKHSKQKRAALVWEYLFVKNTPISEASIGVIKIFKFLKINDYKNKDYFFIRKKLKIKTEDHQLILKKLNIKKVVMTNNPFNKEEWCLFKKKNWNRKFYKSSIRLDDLFTKKFKNKFTQKTLKKFINDKYLEAKPSYFALSLNGDNIMDFFNSNYMTKTIIPFLVKKKLPLMLLVGVKRSINPSFKGGGDGIGNENTDLLEKVIKKYKNLNFLVTHLSDNSQYRLTVLSRKLPNLTLFGFWWFLNQDSYVKNYLPIKISLLGFNFIAQHSDARVFEHLIYKWSDFKENLADVMLEKYQKLFNAGYNIDNNEIKNDMNLLLNKNPNKFL